MSTFQVTFRDNSTDNSSYVDAETTTTVGAILQSQNMNPDHVTIRKNRAATNLGDIVAPGDVISVTRKDLKGADEEAVEVTAADLTVLQEVTYKDIVEAGTAQFTMANSVVAEILTEQRKAGHKALKIEVASLMARLKQHSSADNKLVESLTKQLADAKKRTARRDYATAQLVQENNIFSAMSYLSEKDQAAAVCARLGCSVPDTKSSVWYTSAEDGK